MFQIAMLLKQLKMMYNKEFKMNFTGLEKLVALVLVGVALLTIVLTLAPYDYLHAV